MFNALDAMIAQHGQANDPVRSITGGQTPTTAAPTSFFSAASNVSAGANSIGSSPFGQLVPDFSRLTPGQLNFIMDSMDNLTYSAARGGYLTRAEANDPNSVYNRGYYNYTVGSDANANRSASDLYNFIGGLPTRPIGTSALNALQGYTPSQGPSYNTQLGGSYGGPFAFPNWRNG